MSKIKLINNVNKVIKAFIDYDENEFNNPTIVYNLDDLRVDIYYSFCEELFLSDELEVIANLILKDKVQMQIKIADNKRELILRVIV